MLFCLIYVCIKIPTLNLLYFNIIIFKACKICLQSDPSFTKKTCLQSTFCNSFLKTQIADRSHVSALIPDTKWKLISTVCAQILQRGSQLSKGKISKAKNTVVLQANKRPLENEYCKRQLQRKEAFLKIRMHS